MSKSSAKLMTEGSIWKRIVAFAIPLFWGNLFQQLYNTADSLIVGNFLGSSALAAVSSSGNLIFLMVGLFNGIAIGSGVIVAKYYGARDIPNLCCRFCNCHFTVFKCYPLYGAAASQSGGVSASSEPDQSGFLYAPPDHFLWSARRTPELDHFPGKCIRPGKYQPVWGNGGCRMWFLYEDPGIWVPSDHLFCSGTYYFYQSESGSKRI